MLPFIRDLTSLEWQVEQGSEGPTIYIIAPQAVGQGAPQAINACMYVCMSRW